MQVKIHNTKNMLFKTIIFYLLRYVKRVDENEHSTESITGCLWHSF
jgi:hypothetical protein